MTRNVRTCNTSLGQGCAPPAAGHILLCLIAVKTAIIPGFVQPKTRITRYKLLESNSPTLQI